MRLRTNSISGVGYTPKRITATPNTPAVTTAPVALAAAAASRGAIHD